MLWHFCLVVTESGQVSYCLLIDSLAKRFCKGGTTHTVHVETLVLHSFALSKGVIMFIFHFLTIKKIQSTPLVQKRLCETVSYFLSHLILVFVQDFVVHPKENTRVCT
jgi:hypothetical protein